MRIFIIERVGASIDLSSAEAIGEICLLFAHWKDRPDAKETEALNAAILDKLRIAKFDPDTDAICIAGSQMLNSIFVAAVVGAYCGPIKSLLWSPTDRAYIQLEIGDVETYEHIS